MTDNRFSCGNNNHTPSREMVCIETNRILDSCRDRDCFENVRVLLTEFGNDIIERTATVRTKNACIAWTYINIDPVQFNRGFYTVIIRFYIKLTFEACIGGRAQEFDGVAVVEKKVILYGSESNVSVFRSTSDSTDYCVTPEPVCCTKNVPSAVVEVVDPIVLDTKVIEQNDCCQCYCCCCANDIPQSVSYRLNGTLNDTCSDSTKYLAVSLGIFSVVRIVRPAQYLINAVEYNVPDKECVTSCENDPCSLFRSMAFPTSEFNPPPFNHLSTGIEKRCGCKNDNN